MARKVREMQDVDGPSDDDAPEVVSRSTSKADAKRNRKALHDFESEERTRWKARNRKRDQKLKERARVTRAGEKQRGVRILKREDGSDGGEDVEDDVEARMLRAMRDAADEMGEGKVVDDDDDSDGSGSSSAQYEDAEMSLGSIDPETPDLMDNDDMDEDEEDGETTPHQADVHRFSRKADYLADDLFAAAFASQNLKPTSKKNTASTPQQTVKKRRRKSVEHSKDSVVGGRTIRTLPRLSDPRSQATARSVPSARARRFLDHSLAMKGKQTLLKAKRKGWERRPANVGVMKCQGAPHGFARSTR